jgi:hypothetical protein
LHVGRGAGRFAARLSKGDTVENAHNGASPVVGRARGRQASGCAELAVRPPFKAFKAAEAWKQEKAKRAAKVWTKNQREET